VKMNGEGDSSATGGGALLQAAVPSTTAPVKVNPMLRRMKLNAVCSYRGGAAR
jgi:hypothetical protein